ncbi:MAG: hypothetical protein JNK82_45015 [Myxococcaceae bacterium]|nr:hypothetical protein [Myxococcaceae bacterium]
MSLARRLLSPQTRFTLRRLATRIKVRAPLLTPWRWEARRWSAKTYDVMTFAPPSEHHGRALMQLEGDGAPCELEKGLDSNVALVSPMIIPGAYRVPCELHTIVPLGRSLEEITARYDRELRRTLKKSRGAYTFTRVTDPARIAALNDEMLVPYARARHGADAVCPPLSDVMNMALETGRLDVVENAGKPVACHLGYTLEQGGKRTFITLRFGYPKEIFEEQKKLREANAMNTYLAMEWAHQNHFDGYDMGSASSRPDDGLLQWKRRRDGAVDCSHAEEWLSVRPPASAKAAFLWDHPLFSVENGQLELQLGIAPGVGDDEALARWKQYGFSGLQRVHVYAERELPERLAAGVSAIFEGQTLKPAEIVMHAPRPGAVTVAEPLQQAA